MPGKQFQFSKKKQFYWHAVKAHDLLDVRKPGSSGLFKLELGLYINLGLCPGPHLQGNPW